MKNILLFSCFVVLLTACSDYAKIVKGSDYSQKFVTANALYDQKDFDKAIILFSIKVLKKLEAL